jgi:phosphatidylglycerophosphatase A
MRKIILFFATGFCSGYLPCVPGTYGTVVGMAISVGSYFLFPDHFIRVNIIIFLVMFIPSILIAGKAEQYFGVKDAQQIVIDEMMGYWLSIMFHPFSVSLIIAGFILFRLFDIIKPFPIGFIQRLKGGFGVVADDLMAAVYVNICLTLGALLAGYFGYIVW